MHTRPSAATAAALLAALAGTTHAQIVDPFPARISVTALDDGSTGFDFRVGTAAGLGWAVSAAGDVNGDGIDDLIVADPFGRNLAGDPVAGTTYVVFGSTGLGSTGTVNLSTLNGSTVSRIDGEGEEDASGLTVDAAGDVNGDGIDDLIIGATYAVAEDDREGRAYIVFGRPADQFPSSINLSSLSAGQGLTLVGESAGDGAGYDVSAAGDVNGDGIDDVVLSATAGPSTYNNGTERVYVVFGRSNPPLPAELSLASLDGSNGFFLESFSSSRTGFGISVAGGGDVTGDGIDDIVIGEGLRSLDDSYSSEGAVHILFGRLGERTGSEVRLQDANSVFTVFGPGEQFAVGRSVAISEDVNGDGFSDVVAGSFLYGNGGGFVIPGGPSLTGDPATITRTSDFSTLTVNRSETSNLSFAVAVSSAGDLNGDGFADVAFADGFTEGESGPYEGAVYVVFGEPGVSGAIESSSLNGRNGFILSGENNGFAGASLDAAGDVNGDGVDDLLVGAPYTGTSGNAYVLFGRVTQIWDAAAGGNFDDPFNWLTGRAPTRGIAVVQPPLGGEVFFDQNDEIILSSLTVGAGIGVTTLDLGNFPGAVLGITGDFRLPPDAAAIGNGQLTVAERLTVDGRLAMTGGSVNVGADLNVGNGGVVEIGPGGVISTDFFELNGGSGGLGTLAASGGTIDAPFVFSDGRIDVRGSGDGLNRVEFTGSIDNFGEILLRRGTLEVRVPVLRNFFDLSVSDATADIVGDVVNDDRTAVSRGSSLLITGDLTNQQGSIFTLESESELIVLGSLNGGGIDGAAGPGSAGDVFVEDGINPGFSPGTARFEGDLAIGPAARSTLEIAETETDRIIVAGRFAPGGELRIELLDGFIPERGTCYRLFEFGSVAGDFREVRLPPELVALDADASLLAVTGELIIPEELPDIAPPFGDENFLDVLAYLRRADAGDTKLADLPPRDNVIDASDAAAFLGLLTD